MQYNIIDIVDDELTDTKLKDIINKKLYKIIELMEFNANIDNNSYMQEYDLVALKYQRLAKILDINSHSTINVIIVSVISLT